MIKDLKEIKRNEVNLFGGKATNLGFLIQNGFNVPEGFCISTQVKKLDKEIKNEIIKRHKKLKSKVSVRSSATVEDAKNASFAGQFDTFLNVKDEKELINLVEKCKHSIKSARVNAYLKNKNVKKVKMAVIVQKMVDADYAGVIFTVDPIYNKDILIESIKGLGEKLVSGRTTPSSYFIDRKNYKINNKSGNLNMNQILIQKLARISLKIEKLYNFPQDIEFAIKYNKIYILQSRAITTLKEKTKKLVFEKSITRDWTVIFSQIWHEVYTKEFKKQFGFSLTEVIYEGKNNIINVYRAPDEFIGGMRNFILNKINNDPLWINKQSRIIKNKVFSTIKWIKKIREKSFSKYDSTELAKILNQFVQRNVEIGPNYIIMFWFPVQLEQIRKHQYKKQLKIAKKTRKDIHILGAIANSFTRELAKEVLIRAKLSVNLAKYITYQEILNYLTHRKKINKEILLKRKKYLIITNQGIKFEQIYNYLKRIGYDIKDEVGTSTSFVISGITAYPGFARGKARIITHIDAFRNFKNKDILVTTMTTPDFIPLLKKSAAFVTDEGGITCHAAIISREMKKPCIIGTRNATRILRDNDLIEVDANKGIIRKLK